MQSPFRKQINSVFDNGICTIDVIKSLIFIMFLHSMNQKTEAVYDRCMTALQMIQCASYILRRAIASHFGFLEAALAVIDVGSPIMPP